MSAGKLPEGWVVSTIGEVCDINPKHKHDDDLDVGFMPMADVPTDYLGTCRYETRKWKDVKKGFTQFANNDVIFAKITPCFENGKAAVINNFPNGYGAGSTEYFVLRSVGNLVNPCFFLALIKSKEFLINGALNMSGSVGHKRVPKEFVERYELPIPPLAEQKIIAEKLDTLLAQVDSTKARLEQIPKILKRFRQAVLAAAMGGKFTTNAGITQSPLTIGHETSETPPGWKWHKLIEITKLESGHTPRKTTPEYWKDGDVPWISLQDIRAAHGKKIYKTKFMPTQKGIDNSSARLLPEGTVCFSRDISVGYTTIMGTAMATTQHFANWICSKELKNEYLMFAFMAAKQHLTKSGQGTTVKTIYMPALKELMILIPSLSEQNEIVRRVEQLFAYADTIEKQVNSALARVNNLTQSILAKAFRGELTAQWRAENPELISGENSAAALLEKIKAERAASTGKKASRKKS
ncbi:restriction endonuclease subunit S [Pantoea agglomerans]|uniref:restriction endonuclease subunit S n=1 Tax=Enterobacter agglomerans TaxID=549 RepID=UPI002448DC6F|nr:restriction endonuclease subunit S [Pantoea agglomerans]MDH1169164.1 restriction endonuclease subunit S [Pantoea agglomerans]